MLVSKPQTVPYIGIFKTQAGEEFIGKIINETMDYYEVKSPLCMIATDKGFQFAPLLMMADPEKPVFVPKPTIIATPAKKLEEQYEQAITPIQLIQR